MKFTEKLQKFMYGRYGVDELYKFLFGLYILTFIINIFLNNILLEVLGLLIVLFTFYRVFSKNIYARNKENRAFLQFKKKITKPFTNIKRNIKDKDHIYKKCHKCKTTLKLPIPYERGIKHTTCPKCQNKLTFLVLKKEKVEIIRN